MRRIILVTTLAMMLSVAFITHKMEGRTSASSANLFLAQAGGPTLSINDRSQVEGNGTPSVMVFTVTLTASGTHAPVTVSYATADGSATAPSDYTSRNGALDFLAGTGNATMTISVPIISDTIVELDETFFVNLINPDGATITKGQGVGTIINDDGPTPTPSPSPTPTPTPSPTPTPTPTLPTLSITDVSVLEGNTGTVDAVFTVSLSTPSSSTVTVNYVTTDGTATVADNDYLASSGTLTFPPNSTTQTISIQVVGDTIPELDEHFFVDLSHAVGATTSTSGYIRGECTIGDDDGGPGGRPTLSVAPWTVNNG